MNYYTIRGIHPSHGAFAHEYIFRLSAVPEVLKRLKARMPTATFTIVKLSPDKVGDDHVLTDDPVSIAYTDPDIRLGADVVLVRGFATETAFTRWCEVHGDNILLVDSRGLSKGWRETLS